MTLRVDKAAVLGSGVMGSAIAAHLANAGIRSVMLDVVPAEPNDRERARGLDLRSPEVSNRIGTGRAREVPEVPTGPVPSSTAWST